VGSNDDDDDDDGCDDDDDGDYVMTSTSGRHGPQMSRRSRNAIKGLASLAIIIFIIISS
jgi:hypothetical protein